MAEEKARREEERRLLDEKAKIQAQREAEAEARRAAKRSGGVDMSNRVPSRDPEPAQDRPASGRPRLNLQPRGGAGGTPSWRDREAARASNPAPAAGADEPAAPRTEPPRRSGYVPPALRGDGAAARGDAPPRSDGPPTDRWRPREGSGRGPTRDESPAAGPARYGRNIEREGSGRGVLGRDGVGRDRNESPASGAGLPSRSAGAYVPRHLRDGAAAGGSGPGPRDASPAGSDAAPAPVQGATAEGKYRPGAFRRKQ